MRRSLQPQWTANPKRGLGLNTESTHMSPGVTLMEVSQEEVIFKVIVREKEK